MSQRQRLLHNRLMAKRHQQPWCLAQFGHLCGEEKETSQSGSPAWAPSPAWQQKATKILLFFFFFGVRVKSCLLWVPRWVGKGCCHPSPQGPAAPQAGRDVAEAGPQASTQGDKKGQCLLQPPAPEQPLLPLCCMAVRVFCNACFCEPRKATPRFLFTSCGHVICELCFQKGNGCHRRGTLLRLIRQGWHSLAISPSNSLWKKRKAFHFVDLLLWINLFNCSSFNQYEQPVNASR